MDVNVAHWIDGEPVERLNSAESFDKVNPVTGASDYSVPIGNQEIVDRACSVAAARGPTWRAVDIAAKSRTLWKVADLIHQNLDAIVELEVADTGKLESVAESEAINAADYFEFYAGVIRSGVGDVVPTSNDHLVFTRREPYGVVGVITPWNVPLNQAARACAPALAAGNSVVLKPSEHTPRSSILLARLLREAGLPDGAFNVVLGDGQSTGRRLVENGSVAKVAFTGSVSTGRAIGRIAADRIIPLTLELGGKSANIVFADANIPKAAAATARAFLSNAGQVCSAGARLLIDRSIQDEFLVMLRAEISSQMRAGMPPLMNRAQYEAVSRHVRSAEESGLTDDVAGLEHPKMLGEFSVRPRVFIDDRMESEISRQEVFGPVLVVSSFDNDEQAVMMANDSPYGLIAGVWTKDITRAFRVSESLEVSQVFVNSWSTGRVETPFGGHKMSGHGREKGLEALHHYTHLKTYSINLG